MRTLQNFEVKHIVSIENGEVHRFRGFLRELRENRAADVAKRGMVGDSGAKSGQLRPHNIGAGVVTEEVAFALQMSHEAIGRALVEARLLRNLS